MKKNLYLASNVGMEYFLFLAKVLENTDFQIRTFYYLEESEYRNTSRGSLKTRFILRLKMYLFYPIYLFFCGLLFSNNSIFIVSSGTFYTPYLMQFLLKFKNIKVIQLLYDLYPDILEASKMIKKDSFTSNFLGQISKNNQTKCFGTVYLGSFLKEHAERRWGKSLNSSVIDIATDVQLYNDHFPKENKSQKITIHYGGQLGQAHDVDSIIECLKLFYKTNLTNNFKFKFAISGSKSKYFRTKMRGLPIEIEDTVKGCEWREKIQNYQIGLVGLLPAGASICLPSKTYSMMAGGLAIISICPIWSDLSKLINQNNCGWIVNNSYEENLPNYIDMKSYLERIYSVKNRKIIAENFIKTLEELKQRPELIYEKRKNAYNNVRASYDIQSLSNKWNIFLNNID